MPINLLRPIVAVSRYITFALLAIHEHGLNAREVAKDEESLRSFATEVRRFYPFFPMIGGKVRMPFDFNNHHFAEGEWVVLDIHGTNHDPQIWTAPEKFDPSRHFAGDPAANKMIPQGGGGYLEGHRCPGE